MSMPGKGFIFNPAAFFGSEKVRSMTYEEIGVYVALLRHQWENGDLPADPRGLSVLLNEGAHSASIDKMKEMLSGPLGRCFVVEGERMKNLRLFDEREAWLSKHGKFSESGAKGGAKSRRGKAVDKDDKGTLEEKNKAPLSKKKPPSLPIPSLPVPSGPLQSNPKEEEASSLSSFSEFRSRILPIITRLETAKGSACNFVAGDLEKARSVWCELDAKGELPTLDALVSKVEEHAASAQWTNDWPTYVPKLENWLAKKRFDEFLPPAKEKPKPKSSGFDPMDDPEMRKFLIYQGVVDETEAQA